jgi:hypothetical protein
MINTYSLFFYGKTITSENRSFVFSEGSGSDISVSIASGNYSITALTNAMSRALNNSSPNALIYSVAFNRTTFKTVISANGAFSIKNATLQSPLLTEIGFDDSDFLGVTSATSQGASVTAFEPQFLLQDYVSPERNAAMVSASELVSASGKTQIVRFGIKREVKFDIRWANDYQQGSDSWIKYNPNGIKNLNDFLLHCVEKNIVEFMPDIDTRSTYYRMILVSTEASGDGTAYSLKERFDLNASNYYDSGALTFRLVEA